MSHRLEHSQVMKLSLLGTKTQTFRYRDHKLLIKEHTSKDLLITKGKINK